MYKLTFKVPLRIHMKVSSGFGDGYHDVLLSELDTQKIHGMENLYDCQFNWITRDGEVNEYDKRNRGFDGSEVTMEAILFDYNYFLEINSTKPFDSIVTLYRYYDDKVIEKTLKEAVIDVLKGQLSDGIGENEIGYIEYEGEEYDVWFGDLIEL